MTLDTSTARVTLHARLTPMSLTSDTWQV